MGTGVGGAVVQHGKLVSGASGSAGEIGHLIVAAGGGAFGQLGILLLALLTGGRQLYRRTRR